MHTLAWWLLFASDEITGDLAQAAYPAHFHPRSAVLWLTEDLIHIGYWLHQAIHPGNDHNDQSRQDEPAHKHAARGPEQAQRPLPADDLDSCRIFSIGNQNSGRIAGA